MPESNPITEKQVRCIRVLARKLKKTVPANLSQLSRKEASARIKELTDTIGHNSFASGTNMRKQTQSIDNGNAQRQGNGRSAFTYEEQVRLGLATKLMHQKWLNLQWPVFTWKDRFKKDVAELYILLGELQQELVYNNGRGG